MSARNERQGHSPFEACFHTLGEAHNENVYGAIERLVQAGEQVLRVWRRAWREPLGGPTRAFLPFAENDGYRSRDRNEIGNDRGMAVPLTVGQLQASTAGWDGPTALFTADREKLMYLKIIELQRRA